MALRLDIASGAEWLLPEAKRRLRMLHDELIRQNRTIGSKWFFVDSGERFFIQSQKLMQMSSAFAPQFIDVIRIEAAGLLAWNVRLGASYRTFLASTAGTVALLAAPTGKPDGLILYAPLTFAAFSNYEWDFTVSNKKGRYLAFDVTQPDPGGLLEAHFVYDNTYLGKTDTRWLGDSNGDNVWRMSRTGGHWANTHSLGAADISVDPFQGAGIAVYSPRLATPENPTPGFNLTDYPWLGVFAAYLAQTTGLSNWVAGLLGWSANFASLGGDRNFGLVRFDAGNDSLRASNVAVFLWSYVTGQIGVADDFTINVVQRRVVAVLDSPAFSSELPALDIDPATGVPALGKWRVVSDRSYSQTHRSHLIGSWQYTFNGQYANALANSIHEDDLDILVSSAGKVIHAENVYQANNSSENMENEFLESASLFVDGVQVYTTAEGVIALPGHRWWDKHPVETSDGLAFMFQVVDIVAGTHKYFLCKNGAVTDTGIIYDENGPIGPESPFLTTDAEHIFFWAYDSLTDTAPVLHIWHAGAIVFTDTNPNGTGYILPANHDQFPAKDIDDPTIFYTQEIIDGISTAVRRKIAWVTNPDGSRTYSTARQKPAAAKAAVDEAGTSYPPSSNDLYLPMSAVPK